VEESAGPGAVAAALALLGAGRHGEVPEEVGPRVSAVHYEGDLEVGARSSAAAVPRPHQAAAADRKGFEVGSVARKGLDRLEPRKGWERLDAGPACWEQGKALNRVLEHIVSMALRLMLKAAAGTAMHHAELADRWE